MPHAKSIDRMEQRDTVFKVSTFQRMSKGHGVCVAVRSKAGSLTIAVSGTWVVGSEKKWPSASLLGNRLLAIPEVTPLLLRKQNLESHLFLAPGEAMTHQRSLHF